MDTNKIWLLHARLYCSRPKLRLSLMVVEARPREDRRARTKPSKELETLLGSRHVQSSDSQRKIMVILYIME